MTGVNVLDPRAATVAAIARSLMPGTVFGTSGTLPTPRDVIDLAHDRLHLDVTVGQAEQAIAAVAR